MSHSGLSRPIEGLSNRYFILAFTAVVIACLMSIVTTKLDREVVNAEFAQFDFRLAELRAAVLLQEAALVASDEMSQAYKYEGLNPMKWMAADTSHYLGEMSLESVSGQAGYWAYDPKRQVIAYKGRTEEFLAEKGISDVKWLQFKVLALWSNKQTSKTEPAAENKRLMSNGLRLKQVNGIR